MQKAPTTMRVGFGSLVTCIGYVLLVFDVSFVPIECFQTNHPILLNQQRNQPTVVDGVGNYPKYDLFLDYAVVSSRQKNYDYVPYNKKYSVHRHFNRHRCVHFMSNMKNTEYRNSATQFLSNFMNNNNKEKYIQNEAKLQREQQQQLILLPKTSATATTTATTTTTTSVIDTIDFNAPKFSTKVSLETFAQLLDYELIQKEWFVTGNVNPIYFSNAFQFQDPDVTINSIEEYSRGVYKLFDQSCSRAEIISTIVNTECDQKNVITCTWRLSGKVQIGPGITIKPYIVYTDFIIDETTGLIVSQVDRFDIPQWDILVSAFFPFLIGIVTSPPADPVQPRTVTMPKLPSNSIPSLFSWNDNNNIPSFFNFIQRK